MTSDTMEWQIPEEERSYLRELAQRQAEYARLPIMAKRRQMWYDLNDGRSGARPPVIIETWTFERDFLPANVYRCASRLGKEIEYQLLRNLCNHELMDDDKVMPDTFDIDWFQSVDPFGIPIEKQTALDAEGVETAYRYLHPITNLERDFEKLRPLTISVDKEKTLAWQAFLEDLFGGCLPVAIRPGLSGVTMLTERVIQLMGMQAFYLALIDQPDAIHRLMAYLRDNALALMRKLESENLLRLNNGNQVSFGSSFNFTTHLPQSDAEPGHVRLCDTWGAANSQETVGISPRMFAEFCLPYYLEVCEPFGLLYYGCCEPVHPFWNEISRLPHLKKVSISRWCNQKFMGEALRGSEIVFSRKPDPNFLSLDQSLDEEAWAAHIRETLEATRGVFVEFIIRDVYTVHGNLAYAHRAVEIARREIDSHYQP